MLVRLKDMKVEPPYHQPFPISGGWMGFGCLSRECYTALKPIGEKSAVSGESLPLYCHNEMAFECPHCHGKIEPNGEDFSLHLNAERNGFPVVADARILTRHIKETGIGSYRPGSGSI